MPAVVSSFLSAYGSFFSAHAIASTFQVLGQDVVYDNIESVGIVMRYASQSLGFHLCFSLPRTFFLVEVFQVAGEQSDSSGSSGQKG